MNSFISRASNVLLCLVLTLSVGCSALPAKPDIIPATAQPQTPHSRKMATPSYAGGGAVIFILDQISDGSSQEAVNKVITVFAENDAPLNVALRPLIDQNKSDASAKELTYFSDAGIIDTSIDGYSIDWLKLQASSANPEFKLLTASLMQMRDQVKNLFGSPTFACVMPSQDISEPNYRALQASGFKVVCSTDSYSLHPSIKPVSWSGEVSADGLYRLPIAGSISFGPGTGWSASLISDIKKSLNDLGVAVIEIQLTSVLDGKNKADSTKLAQLKNLIKSCSQLGAITTLENWYYYITGCPPDAMGVKRPLPPYNGGPVIIFRLDDVSKGNREEVVQEIIKLFQRNGVPLDCGVVSNVNGTDSYEIPWLKKYVDENAVGITVHGYDWTFYQMDISKKYLLHIEDNTCINVNTARAEGEKSQISYEEVKFKLLQARCKFLKYFGIMPVSFTVPTDYYDELGFKAVQDAGYKVFSVQTVVEPCPSTEPVDYNCHIDPTKGMYRIPTGSDMCNWYNCKWGDVINIDKPMKQKDYCIYIGAFGESQEYNDYAITICNLMSALGVVSLGLHPDCFTNIYGKPDVAKLEKLDTIVKWFKSFATIMTFEQWYRYRIGEK